MFLLYLPAARAGFVSDFTGWLDQLRNHSFAEYVNRTNFTVVSLYQVTQVITWLFYQVFGTNPWLWHLLFITLHVVNTCLLAGIVDRMLRDAGTFNRKTGVYIGAVLFCITPSLSEVVIWEPSFHYLSGLFMILLILTWVQQYYHTSARRYILFATVVYLLSTHALEVFYITPWLVLSIALFYRLLPAGDRAATTRIIRWFFVVELVIFLLRLIEYRLIYGQWVSRIGTDTAASLSDTGLGKPAKYLFHLLFAGRYLPDAWHIGSLSVEHIKNSVYRFCDAPAGIIAFYSLLICVLGWHLLQFTRLPGHRRAMTLLALWTLAALVLVAPMWFGDMFLIIYDRYAYFAAGFLFMLLGIYLAGISWKGVRIALLAIILLVNLRFAVQASRYWGKSSRIVEQLLKNVPPHSGKTVILLNVPQTMHGAAMIGASAQHEFLLMHDLLLPAKKLNTKVYDALGYNMATPDDGAHVTVLNDSTVRVTLNQWGTWWWYEGLGGRSYETTDYRLNLTDPGHQYELTLKGPANRYLLLYQVGENWKVVDIGLTNQEQR